MSKQIGDQVRICAVATAVATVLTRFAAVVFGEWTFAIIGGIFGSLSGILFVMFAVALFNRRDDPRHGETPPDAP
jgi:uncharacterized membrane protein